MQDAIVYLTIAIFFVVNRWLLSTMMGLRIRSVGENPAAADAAGISVVAAPGSCHRRSARR